MKIFGKELNKNEILKRIGDISQFGELKTYEFTDGLSRGVRAVDVKSLSGIDMTVLIDRGLDISYFSYKSIPICWRSATKETSSIYFESRKDNISRTFYGGLLTTCGLTNMGLPCEDDGEELGLHGRISNLAAENVCINGEWKDDEYVMSVSGRVREVKVLGNKLLLKRKITTYMSAPRVIVEDTVDNIGYKKSPIMILYHVNIGYPVLDSTSKLLEPRVNVIPLDKQSRKGLKNFSDFSEPIKDFKQQIYFHDIEPDNEGNSNIALVNTSFNNNQGIGVWLKFNKNNLPYLVQCKQMGGGEYFCEIGPSNSFVRGRKIEREKENLRFINQGESLNYRLEFNILNSREEIENFKGICLKN